MRVTLEIKRWAVSILAHHLIVSIYLSGLSADRGKLSSRWQLSRLFKHGFVIRVLWLGFIVRFWRVPVLHTYYPDSSDDRERLHMLQLFPFLAQEEAETY